jgi:Ca2+-binding EF-hand superfamily protein
LRSHSLFSYHKRYFDADDSGTITAEEYQELHVDLQANGHLTKYSAAEGLKKLDENGDGVIQFSEVNLLGLET